MASKVSRWADTEEDAALEAKRKREKQEKKRLKAEKARKNEAEREAAEAEERDEEEKQDRPKKRRKTTPLPEQENGKEEETKLLRFQAPPVQKSGSVDKYVKLNDIEEGAYGWVARAKDIATGRVVALKRLKADPADRSGIPVTSLREIRILKDCYHRNVVELEEVVTGEPVNGSPRYASPLAFCVWFRGGGGLGIYSFLGTSIAYISFLNLWNTTSKPSSKTCRNRSSPPKSRHYSLSSQRESPTSTKTGSSTAISRRQTSC